MKELRGITFVFENIETAHIDEANIDYFSIGNVTKEYTWHDPILEERECCGLFYCVLKKAANKRVDPGYNGKTVFERIQNYPDIVDIQLHLYNEPTKSFLVNWPDNVNAHANSAQSTAVLKSGDLLIAVDPNKTAEEVKWLYEPRMPGGGQLDR